MLGASCMSRDPRRSLIVNADDFGQSPGVNRGVARAHEHGVVTSASLMVRFPSATEAAAYASEHPELSVGLHVDLGEWAFRDGDWVSVYRVVDVADPYAVASEVATQIETFRHLLDRQPTHLDSHQHVHRTEPTASVLARAAVELGVPLREACGGVRYCGSFYGQLADGTPYPEGISVETLLWIIHSLEEGTTEVGCHPGEGDLETMYNTERALEVGVLCDPRVRAAIDAAGVHLASFHAVAGPP